MSVPFKSISPDFTSQKRVSRLAIVDFPPPEGPTRAIISFFSALNEIDFGGRFPFSLFEEIASWKEEKSRKISFEKVKILLDSENLTVQICDDEESAFESGFSFLIQKIGEKIEFDDFCVCSKSEKSDLGKKTLSFVPKNSEFREVSLKITFPILVRSAALGDEIEMADGKFKSLQKIFSDWKIPKNMREKIPVVEEICAKSGRAEIRAVVASLFGFKNWILKSDCRSR